MTSRNDDREPRRPAAAARRRSPSKRRDHFQPALLLLLLVPIALRLAITINRNDDSEAQRALETAAVGAVLRQGRRGAQEDRADAALVGVDGENGNNQNFIVAAAGLYDGHSGALSSTLLARGSVLDRLSRRGGLLAELLPALRRAPAPAELASTATVFGRVFSRFNAQLIARWLTPSGRVDGSTALVAVVSTAEEEDDDGGGEEENDSADAESDQPRLALTLANVGNSRAVLCVRQQQQGDSQAAPDDGDDDPFTPLTPQAPWRALPLTLDHLPPRPDEQRRLAAAAVAAASPSLPPSLRAAASRTAAMGRLGGELEVSRSFGDALAYRRLGLSAAPELSRLLVVGGRGGSENGGGVVAGAELVVLTTDGASETLSPGEVCLEAWAAASVGAGTIAAASSSSGSSSSSSGWVVPAPTPARPPAVALLPPPPTESEAAAGASASTNPRKPLPLRLKAALARLPSQLALFLAGVGPPPACTDCPSLSSPSAASASAASPAPAAAAASIDGPPPPYPCTRATAAAARVAAEAVNRGSGDNVGVVVLDVAWLLLEMQRRRQQEEAGVERRRRLRAIAEGGSLLPTPPSPKNTTSRDPLALAFWPPLPTDARLLLDAQAREARRFALEAADRLAAAPGDARGLVAAGDANAPMPARERRELRLRESAAPFCSSSDVRPPMAMEDDRVCEAVVVVPPPLLPTLALGAGGASASGAAVALAAGQEGGGGIGPRGDATVLASLTCERGEDEFGGGDYAGAFWGGRQDEDEDDDEDDDEEAVRDNAALFGAADESPSSVRRRRRRRMYVLERVVPSSSGFASSSAEAASPPHAHVLPLPPSSSSAAAATPSSSSSGDGNGGSNESALVVTSHWWPPQGGDADRADALPSAANGSTGPSLPVPSLALPAGGGSAGGAPPSSSSSLVGDLLAALPPAPAAETSVTSGPEARGYRLPTRPSGAGAGNSEGDEGAPPPLLVGRGAFGEVWRARRRRRDDGENDNSNNDSDEPFVLKRVAGAAGPAARRSALREAYFGRLMARAAAAAKESREEEGQDQGPGRRGSCRLFATQSRPKQPLWGCADPVAAARAGAIDHVGRFVEAFRTAPLAAAEAEAARRRDGTESAATPVVPSPSAPPDAWLVFRDEGRSLHDLMYSALGGGGENDSQSESNGGAPQLLPRILSPSEWWFEKRRTAASSHRFVREVMAQLLRALAAAHAQNVTHRDVKPENLLVREEGGRDWAGVGAAATTTARLRLIDFGSAAPSFSLDRPAADDARLLRRLYGRRGPGANELTLDYAPPELLFGSSAEEDEEEEEEREEDGGGGGALSSSALVAQRRPAVDLYAAGVVMLELVLGTPRVFALSAAAADALDRRLLLRAASSSRGAAAAEAAEAAARRRLAFHLRGLMDACLYPPPPPPASAAKKKKGKQEEKKKEQQLGKAECAPAALAAALRRRDPLGHGLPPLGLDLARALLAWRPSDRPSAAEALRHPFFFAAEDDEGGQGGMTRRAAETLWRR